MNATPWRFLEERRNDGAVNMATDHAILQACDEGKVPPTLRLYGWKNPTLSVGYSQNMVQQVDGNRCRDLKIPIVRRPTGGRAILHDEELTYSVIAPTCHPRFSGGLRQTFQAISSTLMKGLGQLGAREKGVERQSDRRGEREAIKSPACFASSNPFEIAACDRKLIGSAQRRMKSAFLQHGSVLIDMDRELLNSLLLFESPEASQAHLEMLTQATATLNEICGRTVTFEEAGSAFRDGFLQSFSEGFFRGKLTVFELELRKRLLDADKLKSLFY